MRSRRIQFLVIIIELAAALDDIAVSLSPVIKKIEQYSCKWNYIVDDLDIQ